MKTKVAIKAKAIAVTAIDPMMPIPNQKPEIICSKALSIID